MANLFYAFFPTPILLCGLGAIGFSIETLIILLAIGGLFLMGFVAALVLAFLRYHRSQDSEPLSILGDAH